MRRLVSDSRGLCFIADLTILEISSALANRCHQQKLGPEDYDAMDGAFFSDLAEGRLLVKATTSREVIRARDLLRFAVVLKRLKLQSADALIAVSCLELALERKERIIFYLSDKRLYKVLPANKRLQFCFDPSFDFGVNHRLPFFGMATVET